MYIDDSPRHVAPSLNLENDLTVQHLLDKPLPPIRRINATSDLDSNITATLASDRPPGLGRQVHEDRNKMSLFHLFSKPKVERLRGYAEAGMQPPSPEQSEQRASRRGSRGDLKGARLEKPMPGMPRDPSRPRVPVAAREPDPHRQPRPNPDAFDLLHPPPFKRIFSIAVKIAPAHTCLMAGAKGTPAWKVGSTMALGDFDQYERPSSRRSSRAPPPQTPHLQRKIFSLTRNGYLLQYADRGPSDRLPERLQRLTKDTCAIASDLVPGKPYTVQVAESVSVQEVARPDSPSIFTRLGMKHGTPKKQIPSTLIVLDSAKELEEWLFAIRKEIQRQSKPSPTASPQRTRPQNPERSFSNTSMTLLDSQKEYGIVTQPLDRTDSPRQSFSYATRDPSIREIAAPPAKVEEYSSNPRDSDTITATQMYHRQVMLTRQGSDVVSPVLGYESKRRSYHSAIDSDRGGSDVTSSATTIATSPARTERKMSIERSRPYTPTAVVKSPTGLRQLSNADHEDVSPMRNDSLMKSPDLPSGFVEHREASNAARMRKRASHQGPPVQMPPPDRPQLRTVSSLGRLRSGQPLAGEHLPMPPPMPLEIYGPTSKILASGRVATRKMDNDEYHAFQLSMSSEPNPPSVAPSKRGRRHSAMPSQSSGSSTNSTGQRPFPQRPEQVQRSTSRDPGSPQAPRQLPPRLPFKLRGSPDAVAQSLSHPKQPSPPTTSVGSASNSSGSAINPQKLRRPTSMQVRPNAAPFLSSVRSASGNSPSDPRLPPLDTRKPVLRTSRSDHNLTTAGQRQRMMRPPSNIAENLSDDEDMFIIQGAEPLRRPSTSGPLPPPDLGMPLVALGPPPPPPETPLPRLPPPPLGSRPSTPLAVGQ
ncbi:hypothetical protein CAC42_4877 [Sphaceloma murrayae]|uniref:PH domain-containing protein n=1 Tax=Sphaceloma murrayae TaxID=2082308 RepID=A0A2K1QPW9_9PEZI|nr:hypothetical protein CAC42_4877 [Sphaceloma murrayae]